MEALSTDSSVVLVVNAPSGRSVRVETMATDCILDIRNYLLDCPETCDLTCYHLEHNGKPLNDYVEVSEYPALLAPAKAHHLTIVPDFYDDRSAKMQVRRLRELLVNPPAHVSTLANLHQRVFGDSKSAPKPPAPQGPKYISSFSLADFRDEATIYASKKTSGAIQECVGNISFSAWNPPPGNRKLCGDLFYLEVTTLEHNTLHITASVDGFFLNQSTNSAFDPLPHGSHNKSHSFADLLKKSSAQFSSRFSSLLNRKITTHPFETVVVPLTVTEWNAVNKQHSYDWNRAEDSLLSTYGMDSRGALRDWNEEYQSSREMPKSSEAELIIRQRTIYRIYSDFVEAATKGAVAIIEGNIPPINPMDQKRSFVYIFNNIFFSFAIDAKDQHTSSGGDRASHALANHDLKGIEAISKIEIDGLHTLATVIADYGGQRIIAQSIIPGIFHGEKASSHTYGSMDKGVTIQANADYHKLIVEATSHLHTHGATVEDKDGKIVKLATCFDTKGIVGSDSRKYLLDIVRTTPRDTNFPDSATHSTALLRVELLNLYMRHRALQLLQVSRAEISKANTALSAEGKEALPLPGTAEFQNYISQMTFNCDLLTDFPTDKQKAPADELSADLKAIQDVSGYLVKNRIPQLMKEFQSLTICPSDTASLRSVLHANGVNIRYLGMLTEQAKQMNLKHIENLCIQEMTVRAAKFVLASCVREVRPSHGVAEEHQFVGPCVAAFLSAFLGPSCGGNSMKPTELEAASRFLTALEIEREADKKEDRVAKLSSKKAKKQNKRLTGPKIRMEDGSWAASNALDPVNVWQAIRKEVNRKYAYPLPEHTPFTASQKLTMLRSLCQKFGIQVATRDYELAPDSKNAQPFRPSDIVMMFPVIKFKIPGIGTEASNMMETGKLLLNQGNIVVAGQYLTSALHLLSQTVGPMHELSAQCYSNMAMICYHSGDFSKAVDHGECALIIFQRILGLDHAETAAAHSNLALFLHSSGHFNQALAHLRRAIYLFELICGTDHPETASAHLNIAMIYQDTDSLDLALAHLHEALRCSKAALGDKNLHVAICEHAIAVAYGFQGGFGQAISHERKSMDLYKELLGEEHTRVKQSAYWLSQFTARALEIQNALKGQPLPQTHLQDQSAQNKLNLLSPLTWTSLRNSATPFKGRVTMNHLLRAQQKNLAAQLRVEEQGDENEEETEPAEQKKFGGTKQQKKNKARRAKKLADRAEREKDLLREQQEQARRREELAKQQEALAKYVAQQPAPASQQ